MRVKNYKLTDTVAGFEEGDILDVTARFGDWHTHELKLEQGDAARSQTVVVTGSEAGFSEDEILDETARIGDWHEYDLTFDPVTEDEKPGSTGQIHLSMDQFEAIAEPVDASA
jgi:hypothetical protein